MATKSKEFWKNVRQQIGDDQFKEIKRRSAEIIKSSKNRCEDCGCWDRTGQFCTEGHDEYEGCPLVIWELTGEIE